MDGFSRQEAIALTGCKPGNLGYWDEAGLIVPVKDGNPKRPRVVYSVDQVIELAILEQFRATLSLQKIRKVLDFLRIQKHRMVAGQIVLVSGIVTLVENPENFGFQILSELKSKKSVSIENIGSVQNVSGSLRENAHKHRILDFDKRIQGTVLGDQ